MCLIDVLMPQKNSRKEYGAGEHYHVYNRGVEKRKIFLMNKILRFFGLHEVLS